LRLGEGNVFSFASTPFTLGIAETPVLQTSDVSGAQGATIALPSPFRRASRWFGRGAERDHLRDSDRVSLTDTAHGTLAISNGSVT